MSNNTPAAVPAGWYPDPAGTGQQRWWNGTSWSDTVQSTPAAAAPASPYGTAPVYGATQQPYIAQPYTAMQSYGAAQPYGQGQSYYGSALRAPEGTNPTTTQAWIMAFWPLIGLVASVVTALSSSQGLGYSPSSYLSPADGISALISLVSWLGFAGVAFSDSQELKRRGLPQPFGWGWGFIPIVYVIGRAVVVHARTGTGLAPLFVWIGCVVFNWIAAFAIGIAIGLAGVSSYYN